MLESLKKPALNEKLAAYIQSNLPVYATPELRKTVNFEESQASPIHRWFRYREGFSPTILDKLNGAERVFDPFCGCGTTLIEAKKRGIAAVGTDVNPLAVFVAKVKTRNYNAENIREFKAYAANTSPYPAVWPEPGMLLLPKLFQPEALHELLKIRAALEECENPKVKDLLLLCWLSILESCSNIFKEGNGIKYRNKKRQPREYATVPDRIWIPRYFGQSIRTFVQQRWREKCLIVIDDLEELAGRSHSTIKILEQSCLDTAVTDDVQTCDASVFSPPYANRFDYFEAFKIELWMGNFVTSAGEMRALRNRSMRNNLTVQVGAVRKRDDLESFLELMDENASSVRMGIRETLRGYFDDVARLAANLRTVLSPNGKVLCVVGNSAYAGVLVPTDLLCARIFLEAGFSVEAVEVARHLHVSSQQRKKMAGKLEPYMRESIIICRR